MAVFPTLHDHDFLFIIGAPRSGTTMLQIVLGSHPQVATTVELTVFNRYLAPWLKTWDEETVNLREKGFQQGLPFVFSEEEFLETALSLLERVYARVLARKPAATHVLDKHPPYSLHVATIKRLLPRARFLHVIRDGRDVACSMTAAHRAMNFGTETLGKSAAVWAKYVRAAREAAQFGGDYLEVRFEDLVQQDTAPYAAVLDFCQLSWEPAWLTQLLAANTFEKMRERQASGDERVKMPAGHYRRGRAGGWEEEFSAQDRFVFDQRAGDLLCDLGYAQPGWWAPSTAVRLAEPLRQACWRRMAAVRHAWKVLHGKAPRALIES